RDLKLCLSERNKLMQAMVTQTNGPIDGKEFIGEAYRVVRSRMQMQVAVRNDIADSADPGNLSRTFEGSKKSYVPGLAPTNGLLDFLQRNLLERGCNSIVQHAI